MISRIYTDGVAVMDEALRYMLQFAVGFVLQSGISLWEEFLEFLLRDLKGRLDDFLYIPEIHRTLPFGLLALDDDSLFGWFFRYS